MHVNAEILNLVRVDHARFQCDNQKGRHMITLAKQRFGAFWIPRDQFLNQKRIENGFRKGHDVMNSGVA